LEGHLEFLKEKRKERKWSLGKSAFTERDGQTGRSSKDKKISKKITAPQN
jgi:hypothetical protein